MILRMDRERMQVFRGARLLSIGAVALGLAAAVAGAVAVAEVDRAFAREDDTELDGVVEAIPEAGLVGVWQVGGKTVQVTEATVIDQAMGAVSVGVAVEVEGESQPDGSIVASEIEVEDIR